MSEPIVSDKFIDALTKNQLAIRGYIRSSLGGHTDSDDVTQKTNLVLWKKAAQWDDSTPFLAWALRVARFEVLAFYRDKKRERLVFDEDVSELMADTSMELVDDIPERILALRSCFADLKPDQKELLTARYAMNLSIPDLTQKFGRSEDGVKSLLLRLRKKLNACISSKIKLTSP